MAKKRSKNKIKNDNIKQDNNDDITGIILITLGILMLFSIISPLFTKTDSVSGVIGNFLNSMLITIFGLAAYLVPFFIIFIGICYIMKKGKLSFNKKFYGIILFITNTLLFIQMINIKLYYTKGEIIEGIKKIYNSSNAVHGGIISYLIDIPMYTLFGSIGSYVIFFGVYIISFILILNVTLRDLFIGIKNNFVNLKNSIFDSTKNENSSYVDNTICDTEELFIINAENETCELDKNNNEKIDDNKGKNLQFNDIECNDYSEIEVKNNDKESTKHKKEKNNENLNKELEEEIQSNAVKRDTEYIYNHPSIELLNENVMSQMKKGDKKELLSSAAKLQETLSSFGVEAKVVQVTKGPSVTRFELQPSAGVKVSKIVNLADDIALNLASAGVRIEAPIPGKAAVGIEVPNKDLSAVFLREVIESPEFTNSNKNLAFCLGKDIGGNCIVSDLSKMPHMLVAGATGSGKSVCINTLLISLLYKYSPEDVKLLLIDPKVVELSVYNGIPHLLIPVVTDPKKAAGALNWAVNEMTRRYKAFADNCVRNIEGYNELARKGIIEEKLPWIVIIIDELADLMMVCPNDVEDYIGRLAQMARAAGMHLVIATQRPSVDVITGVIKANIPSRISFAVSSQIDSRTILDSAGAEKLLGKGDMLFYPVGESKPIRIQGAFVSEDEVEKVVEFIKDQKSDSDYREEILDQIEGSLGGKSDDGVDELLNEAIKIVVETGQASTSLLQRKLKIGYNRAARIIDQMEERNIISGRNGSKPRQILVDKDELED